MSLKFTFGGAPSDHDHAGHDHDGAPSGIPLPFAGASSSAQPASSSAVLEIRVSREAGAPGETEAMVAEAFSGDGVSYARAEKPLAATDAAALATAARSAIARVGATLPEPLIGAVTAVVLSLGAENAAVLAELGIAESDGSAATSGAFAAVVDDALQARTGVTAGTPIRVE